MFHLILPAGGNPRIDPATCGAPLIAVVGIPEPLVVSGTPAQSFFDQPRGSR